MGFELKHFDKCIEYLELGKDTFPKEWKFPFLQAYISLFLLSEPAKSVKFLGQAEKIEGSPKYVADLRKTISEKLKFTVNWTDLNSAEFPLLKETLTTDPFFIRLFEIQKKLQER